MAIRIGALALLSNAITVKGDATAVTPVQKVLQLMDELMEKSKAEKHDEEVRFTKMKQWCESTEAEKNKAIRRAAKKMEQLNADIMSADADAEQAGEEVAELEAQIGKWDSELKAATAQRKAENTEYSATHQDYSESITAIEKATNVLKQRTADIPQALLQLQGAVRSSTSMLPAEAKRALLLAAEMRVDASSDDAPEANAYEFQSGSVVGLLEKLHDRFMEERLALEKDETNKKHAFEAVADQLTQSTTDGKNSRDEKAEFKARRNEDSAEGTGDLQQTIRGKDADSTYLTDMMASCEQKSKDFASRQELRAGEIEAIQKAIDIISSPEVSGAADKHLPASFLQRATSLASLRSKPSRDHARDEAVAFLKKSAKETGSQLLETMAGRVSEDPFVKIRTMIKDLIAKLIAEANEEADHKGWCDGELKTNKQTRDEKSTQVSDLTAQSEQLTALEAKLTDEIATLKEEVASIDAAMKEATEDRVAEKEKNTQTLAESKAAEGAVMQALTVLREFYAKAATATAFVQTKQNPDADMPGVFDESYKGAQGASTGIIGMLEVVLSDFQRLISDTTSSESEAQREFESLSKASEEDTKTKEKQARHKGFALVRATRDLGRTKKDLEATQNELDAALEYYEKLKPTCIGESASYEERVQMRKQEIQSLKEALTMLGGEELSDW